MQVFQITSNARARKDLEEVLQDPSYELMLEETEDITAAAISNPDLRYGERADFIITSLGYINNKRQIEEELSEIEREADKNGIGELTAEWIHDYNSITTENKERVDRRNFIHSSFQNSEPIYGVSEKNASRKTIWKYSSFAAAAVLGIFLVTKILTPSGNPEKIFNDYYEPLKAKSILTRGIAPNVPIYNTGIDFYKSGNYKAAYDAFMLYASESGMAADVGFMIALTEIETGNLTDAVAKLSDIIEKKGQYTKDARWYLGLIYLKTGDRTKALNQFELLAGSDGFYRDPSIRILRRLK